MAAKPPQPDYAIELQWLTPKGETQVLRHYAFASAVSTLREVVVDLLNRAQEAESGAASMTLSIQRDATDDHFKPDKADLKSRQGRARSP